MSKLPDWIYPDAPVLFETTKPGGLQRIVRREIVKKITKTQIVLTNTDTRIRVDDLRGVGQQPYGNSYTLLDPASEKGIIAWRREEVRRIRAKAHHAATDFLASPNNSDGLDKTIASLTRWSETLKTTSQEFL